MLARLKPSPLDDLREPLHALRLRGWIHAGIRPLDGVLMDRSRVGSDWRLSLASWLEHAADIRASGDLVLVLFAAPLVRDCSALGPCLPVSRHAGILSTAPFLEPEPEVAASLREQLVHVSAGRPSAVPLSDFTALDVAGWWSLEGVELVPAERVPALRPAVPRRLVSAPAIAAETLPHAAMRMRLARRPRRSPSQLFADLGLTLRRMTVRILRLLWLAYVAIFVLSLVGGVIAAFLASLDKGGSEPNWAAIVLLLGVVVAANLVFRRRARAVSSQPGAARPGSAAPVDRSAVPAMPAGTPFWKRAAAWLAWHTPYAARLRWLYAQRIAEVERLFAANRTDEALHKAIGLGGPTAHEGAFADLPLTGPGLRTRLQLDFGMRKASRLGIAPEDEARLRALYGEQATALARTGDADRAAFVLDELVGDPNWAVRTLVEAGRFESAARLAEARRLGAGVAVPLWFRAGRTERAMALAARHDAFAELWKEVRPGDPFRDVLAEAWAGRLAAAGSFDHAARLAWGISSLAVRRLGWIEQALATQTPPRPESLARALRALPWGTAEDDPIHAAFIELLTEPDAPGALRRLAVAGHLADRDFEGGAPLPPTPEYVLVCRALVRRLVEDQGMFGHDSERERLAVRLADAGGQFALRQHLRRLSRHLVPLNSVPMKPVEIADGPSLAEIADVALLSGGQILIGYRSGLLRLLSRNGRERWRGQVEGLLGFATMGMGERVFVLRATLEGPVLLIFDAGRGRLTPCGPFPGTHWHPHATETGWLVFDGEALVMLDPAPLLATPEIIPEAEAFVHHWRLPVTEPGHPLVLAQFGDSSVLVLGRYDGLFEWWTLSARTLAVTCRFWTPPPCRTGAVLGIAEGVAWSLDGEGENLSLRPYPHVFTPATRENERDLIEKMASVEPHYRPRLVASDHGRVWAASSTQERMIWCSAPGPNTSRGVTVTWHGSQTLRTRFSREDASTAIFDERGRLIVLDALTGATKARQF